MPNRQTFIHVLCALLMGLSVAVGGCGQQGISSTHSGTPTVLAVTSQMPTLAPQPTRPAAASPTALPVRPTLTPDLAVTAATCNPAAQVTDVTVPDGSKFKPGEAFAKTWRFLNSGNCAWEKGSTLVFQAGEKLGAPDNTPMDAVDVGKSVDVSVTMKAPRSLGTYVGLWVLRQPSGQIIAAIDVRIVVSAPIPSSGATLIAPAAKPTVRTVGSSIPPVGSGAFSVDSNASGPWNCVAIDWKTWRGDFYIGVYGGPGNYTISDPEHCHWDLGEQRFACNYTAGLSQALMLTLEVGCPGCAPQKVALYGRAVESRDIEPGVCRITRPY